MDIFDNAQGHQSSAGHWKILVDQALVSPDIVRGGFRGEGTESSPHIVGWASGDLRNPRNWSKSYKWILTINTAIGSLAVSFSSSAYSGGLTTVMEEFNTSPGIPFGFGMVLVFVGVINYLVDSYTIFAASVMAGNSVLRSLFGAAFPLFTVQMYEKLGIHWASTLAAFLALVCLPFPFLFFKHGHRIRAKCKYAAEAEFFMRMLREEGDTTNAEFSDGQEKTDTGRAEFSDGTYEDKEDISMDEP
ncbi:hypothetical protein SLS56_000317 [Neofusicoccum ribis]|uniref:Uncharacterized protein n=1 Tax=Neofusicoccum ribis TaxID=45134 RepID=A0ABR3TEG2_9PEZI